MAYEEHAYIKIPPRMGFREYKMAAAILNDLAEHGFPVDWIDEQSPLSIGFNPRSGFVYLCNEEGDCAVMLCGSRLFLRGFAPKVYLRRDRARRSQRGIPTDCTKEGDLPNMIRVFRQWFGGMIDTWHCRKFLRLEKEMEGFYGRLRR